MNTELEDSTRVRATMERALRDVDATGRHWPRRDRRRAPDPGPPPRRPRRVGLRDGGSPRRRVGPTARGRQRHRRPTGPTPARSPPVPARRHRPPVRPRSTPRIRGRTSSTPRAGGTCRLDQMLAALEQRLPAGVRIVDPNADGEGPGDTSDLDVILEGPSGTGRLVLMLRPKLLSEDELPDPVTSTDAEGNEDTSVMMKGVPYARNIGCRDTSLACEILRDAAGDKIGDVSTETDGGTTYHNADLLGPRWRRAQPLRRRLNRGQTRPRGHDRRGADPHLRAGAGPDPGPGLDQLPALIVTRQNPRTASLVLRPLPRIDPREATESARGAS